STCDRRVGAIVTTPAATGDSRSDERLDESVERMSNGHVGKRCARRIGADLKLVADASPDELESDTGLSESHFEVVHIRCVVNREWRERSEASRTATGGLRVGRHLPRG